MTAGLCIKITGIRKKDKKKIVKERKDKKIIITIARRRIQ